MTNNIKNTLAEVKNIIQELKVRVDTQTDWKDDEKAKMEARLAHLLDKTEPEADVKLDTDLGDLEKVGELISNSVMASAQEITKLKGEITKLLAEGINKDTELDAERTKLTEMTRDRDSKVLIINSLNEAKITRDLIDKINALSASTYDATKIAELKTLLENLADKTPEKVDYQQVAKAVNENQPPSWSTYVILGVVVASFITAVYSLFTQKDKKERKYEEL